MCQFKHMIGPRNALVGLEHPIDPFRVQSKMVATELDPTLRTERMNNLFRGLIAGGAAYKWGGGCFGTVLVFIVIWMLLGQC